MSEGARANFTVLFGPFQLAVCQVHTDFEPGKRERNGCRFMESGGVYKLAFGPKAFIVVSDPVVVRYLLKVRSTEHAFNYRRQRASTECVHDNFKRATRQITCKQPWLLHRQGLFCCARVSTLVMKGGAQKQWWLVWKALICAYSKNARHRITFLDAMGNTVPLAMYVGECIQL